MSRPSLPVTARALVLCATLVLAVCCCSATAGADVFGPISLASVGSVDGGPSQQAEYAHDPAISGNGRYVAFDGSIGGVTGVWRRDLATGAIEQVAGGDAELPSISENGRYISFTSGEDLAPADEAEGVNVWVRDMEPQPGEPQYILASAVSGSSHGLTYEYTAPEHERASFGSVATGRSAISANGQEVAFVTTAPSNLAGPHTPRLQVAVRYLQSEQTVLVSGAYDPADGQTTDEPVQASGGTLGAVYPGTGLGFGSIEANGMWRGSPPPGASISADGSTVAWMGEDIGEQVQMLPGETPAPLYTEPLWRRIEPGSQTPTERVTGGSEPGNPACGASGETALPPPEAQSPADPCQGPFRVQLAALNESRGIWTDSSAEDADFVPRLSADGYAVAFLATALPITRGIGFSADYESEPADVYVANMHPGLTRVQALTPVTQIAGIGIAAADPITDFDIAPDGEQVAFTTRRTEFPLGSPAYVSAPEAVPGESELFDADLGDATLTRVTQGYEGGPSEQPHKTSQLQCPEDPYCLEYTEGAQSPSFSASGLLAFSSTASNLVFGDGNTPPAGPFDGSDAFVVERRTFTPLPAPQSISPAPQTVTAPSWRLGVTALSQANGSVLLHVLTPGAGTLHAGASSFMRVTPARPARTARHRSGHGASRRAAHAAGAHASVVTRTVASAGKVARAGGGELLTLVLNLAKPYAGLAAGAGLSATVTVTFTVPGRPTLRETIPATFLRESKPAAPRARKAHRSASTRSGASKAGRASSKSDRHSAGAR